jgi:hypothetical protein
MLLIWEPAAVCCCARLGRLGNPNVPCVLVNPPPAPRLSDRSARCHPISRKIQEFSESHVYAEQLGNGTSTISANSMNRGGGKPNRHFPSALRSSPAARRSAPARSWILAGQILAASRSSGSSAGERLGSLAGPAGRNTMPRKAVMAARSSASLCRTARPVSAILARLHPSRARIGMGQCSHRSRFCDVGRRVE